MPKLAHTPIALALGALALTGVSLTTQAAELRLSTFVPPVHVIYREIITPWAKEVEQATKGEVKITLYPSMQLGGKPPQLYRQVSDGVVDMTFTLPGYTSAALPRTQMIELPGLKKDGIEATNMMWDIVDPFLLPDYKDVKIIALWGAEDAGLMTRSKKIEKLEDLKGLRMRAPSAQQAKQLEKMGAVPVAMPITQVYRSIERGVVDGSMVPFSTIVDFRLGEVAKAYTIPGPLFGRSSFLIAMNKKKYDSLSPASRAAIDRLSGRQLSLKATNIYMQRSEQGVNSVMGKAFVTEFSPEEQKRIAAVLKPIIVEWVQASEAKGIPAKAMLRKAGYPVDKL
jgi:TRAP-type C4-dicarboxylate transport system substrate-binding protein